MTRHAADPNVVDPEITTRSRRARPLGVIVGFAIVVLIIAPLPMYLLPIGVFCFWLSILMAAGLVLAGLWSCYTLLFTPDVIPDLPPENRLSETILTLLITAFLGAVMFFTAWIVTSLGSTSYFSYNVLKVWGLISYILLGSLPVVAYALTLHAVATRQVITTIKWKVITIFSLVLSLAAPWFWAGFKLYADYHHM